MGYPSGRTMSSAEQLRMVRVSRISSRSDLFPRLIAMQKLADAQGFAIFRVSGSGIPAKQRLVCELENWGLPMPVSARPSRMLMAIFFSTISTNRCCRCHGPAVTTVRHPVRQTSRRS